MLDSGTAWTGKIGQSQLNSLEQYCQQIQYLTSSSSQIFDVVLVVMRVVLSVIFPGLLGSDTIGRKPSYKRNNLVYYSEPKDTGGCR